MYVSMLGGIIKKRLDKQGRAQLIVWFAACVLVTTMGNASESSSSFMFRGVVGIVRVEADLLSPLPSGMIINTTRMIIFKNSVHEALFLADAYNAFVNHRRDPVVVEYLAGFWTPVPRWR